MLKKTLKKYVNKFLTKNKHTSCEKIYPVSEHHIDINAVSRNAIKVCEVLQSKGYNAYIVGGAVRDLILGHQPKDFDVATNATPEKIRASFRRARIIGRRFRLVHVVFGSEIIETSTFRDSGQHLTDHHGRILNDNTFGNIQSDAARRDFTLNALYYDPIKQEVIDYHNGVNDLHKKIVRIIGDAQTRYREDPVRMLRAVRFAAKLNATIEKNTHEKIQPLANLIANVPHSRLFDESIKLLTCGNALVCLKQLRKEGLHKGILPLLDLVLAQEGGQDIIKLTLERTDHRVRTNRRVSPSFLYAAILWPLVNSYAQEDTRINNTPAIPALVQAAHRVLSEHAQSLALQKRHSAEMREIWLMQPRFLKRNIRFIWRMAQQPYFRAACDFLQIRAACHEFDTVLAQWWMDFANATDAEKETMMTALLQTPTKNESGTRRKRRPRRRSAKKSEPA